ncbi:propionyl-coenzyme A carboxylase alpha polypeptide [Agrobacterium fabrum]|nr:propionyl-coenzyme A carboxylase alpha polypeptide [Agrobacterium fabrum]
MRFYPPSALPGISPSRGEIGKSLTPCPISERVRHLISLLEGEMPGRAEGGNAPHRSINGVTPC